MKSKKTLGGQVTKLLIVGIFMLAGLIAIALGAALFAPIYGRYVFHVGRFHGGTELGDDYSDVWQRTQRMAEGYPHRSELQIATGNASDLVGWSQVLCEDGTRPTRFVHIYDWFLMDDVQLYIFFDENDKVCKQIFWAD